MATVLLVDDHPDLADVLGQLLQIHGHEVSICHCAEEALRLMTTQTPDAIIIDERLPGLSGLEFLRLIRGDDRYCALPVILCSADRAPEADARNAGATEFWLKGSDQLFDGVERLGDRLSDPAAKS